MNVPGAGTKPIRLLLVDEQPSVRRGLRMRFALEPDLEVIGEAGEAAEAISLAQALDPNVILMDVEMPGVSGIAAIETLRAVTPRSAVVIFTLYDDAAMRARAREAGAAAFVAKHQTEETLLAAIRRAVVEHEKEEHADDVCERGDR
ncbi:MAG: response regulator transcription factor [Actinomycetota bacterium]|nr:response regulator transcription factor [Actinomycetota bacterium]